MGINTFITGKKQENDTADQKERRKCTVWVMAHFTAAYESTLRSDWIKADLQRCSGCMEGWSYGGEKRGRQCPACRGKTPWKVPVWRENHVEAANGSLRGLCTEDKKADDLAQWSCFVPRLLVDLVCRFVLPISIKNECWAYIKKTELD